MFARPSWLIAFLAIAAPGLNAQPSAGYYDSALGKTGVVLRLALHNVIKGHTVIPYSSSISVDVVDALSALDEDPLNTNNVILIYTRRSEAKTNFNVTGGWNREHLWPNSYGIDSRGPAYSDLHHLRPEDENVNSARGNKFFDLSNTNDVNYRRPGHAEAPFTSTDTDSWEPPDAVKGDIARAMFYVDVRYEGERTNELDLMLTDRTPFITSIMNLMGRLTTLLRWHLRDPVDAAELRRNDVVDRRFQHNRNPFVDHPEWVESLWTGTYPSFVATRIGGQLRVSWSTNEANATLERSAGFPANWLPVAIAPQRLSGEFVLQMGLMNTMGFFRLRVP